ncbi:protein Ted1p [Monosporozyma unispora]|nr:hypothetical protein C6P44_000764 [Kazachstania unispora]
MLKSIVKKVAIFGTILAIFSNIFIFTYPSIHPSRCSWDCAATTKQDNMVLDGLPMWEKSLYYAKRYIDDVKLQWNQQDQNGINGNNSTTTATDSDELHILTFGDPQIKGIWKNTPYRSRLDIFGNDYYLGHIYSMMKKRLDPSHIVVLGDLFSSQWVPDNEFYNRTKRYMKRIFNRPYPNITEIKDSNHDEQGLYKVDWQAWGDEFELQNKTKNFGFGYSDVYSWNPDLEDILFVNVTGNHDTGYSGDVTYQHLARFQQIFGKDNYWIEYNANTEKAWRLVVLNDLLLEGPALQPEFIDYTWEFLYQLFERKFNGSTVLVTHVPFYKEEGMCVDGPEIGYYPADYEREPYKAGLLRYQNHIGQETTNKVLNLIFNNDKPGIILVGHDHEGCEVTYNRNSDSGEWTATRDPESESKYHIKEATVRSMMGEFNGNSGLVTGKFNHNLKQWEWTYTLCPFGIQHGWWIARVSALLTGFFWSLYLVL